MKIKSYKITLYQLLIHKKTILAITESINLKLIYFQYLKFLYV